MIGSSRELVEERRGHDPLYAPARSAVRVPGAGGPFGPGFWQRLRKSGAGMLLVFIAVGGAIFLFGLAGTVGPFRDGLRANGDPRFFLAAMAFGTVFILMASRMLQIALTGATAKLERRTTTSEPWRTDYPWRPAGMEPDYTRAGGSILGPVAFFSLIAMFNIGWGSDSLILKALLVIFDLFALLILLDIVRRIWQAVRHRRPRIRWTTFPAFLGERLEGVVGFAKPLAARGPAKATLRLVRDEQRSSGKQGTMVEEPYVLYTQKREVTASDPLLSLELAFDLPADLAGTDLNAAQPTYWQVLIQVPVAGPDFETVFLAPVYARSALT